MHVTRARLPFRGGWVSALRATPDPGYEAHGAGSGAARTEGAAGRRDGAAGGRHPGVLLVHDAWGLDAEAEMLAEELAEAGVVVLAPDLLGGRVARTPGEARALAAGLDPENAALILAAAVDVLANEAGVRLEAVGALGMGMGAPLAIFLATLRPAVSVVVAAGPVPELPLEVWDRATAEVVVVVAGARAAPGGEAPGGVSPGDEVPGDETLGDDTPAVEAARLRLEPARAAGRVVEVREIEPGEGDPEGAVVYILVDRLITRKPTA